MLQDGLMKQFDRPLPISPWLRSRRRLAGTRRSCSCVPVRRVRTASRYGRPWPGRRWWGRRTRGLWTPCRRCSRSPRTRRYDDRSPRPSPVTIHHTTTTTDSFHLANIATTPISNKWPRNFNKRPHRYLVTSRGGEWIRPRVDPHLIQMLPSANMRRLSNGISISSAVLTVLTNVTNRQRDTQTETQSDRLTTLPCVSNGSL